MQRLALIPILLIFACVVAGTYGALHNQVSYTVSPDYFHAFKFKQFGIAEHLQGRQGAAMVGWSASWWMGLLIGLPVVLIGLILPEGKRYLSRCVVAFGVVAGTALVVGLSALAYASLTISAESLPDFWYPEQVVDKVAFARAATMHNFSYLGGLLGILTASVYLTVEHMRRSTRLSRQQRGHERPMADQARVAAALQIFPYREQSAEQYAARRAHTISCSAFDQHRYPDPALGAWIDELHRLLRSPAELERCRRAHLTPAEYAAVRAELAAETFGL